MRTSSHVVVLDREPDIYLACEKAAGLATAAGFDRYACADIETAVSEVATNALRHANGGWAAIRLLDDRFEVVVKDRGPRPPGAPKTSGLGIGLEGARRLMTSLTFTSLSDGSTVTMSRELPHDRTMASAWGVTAVYRAKSGNTTSGDAAAVCELPDGSIRAALADGLGSGEMASSAARLVLEALDLRNQRGPASAITAADAATRHTRGAAVSVVYLARDGAGVHAGLGDVTCQITSPAQRFVNRPGIVGTGNGTPVDTPFPIEVDGAALMWTDGMTVSEAQVRELRSATSPVECMEQIVMADGDRHDDAAFLMVRR